MKKTKTVKKQTLQFCIAAICGSLLYTKHIKIIIEKKVKQMTEFIYFEIDIYAK